MSKQKIQEIVTQIWIKALEGGELPWKKTWANGMPANLSSKKPYRGFNIMTLALSGHSSKWWGTLKQIKAKKGRVRKEEMGNSTPIIFWRTIEKEDDQGDKHTYFILRFYKVWNMDQLESPIELGEDETGCDFEPIEACETIVSEYNGPEIKCGQTFNPCYSPSKDEVLMPEADQFESPEAYYATLFHELGHSTGHEDRLAREGVTDPIKFGSHNYSQEELVAEFTAAMLCGETGISPRTIDNQAAYIQSWLKRLQNDRGLLIRAAGAAQKAADHIKGKEYQK